MIRAFAQGAARLRLSAAVQALAAGAVSVAALPPVDALPALLAYGWLLALLLDAPGWRAAWRQAFLFSFAQAVTGLHWIAVAFTVDAERFGALAVPAVLLLCVAIALIQGTVASLIRLHAWRSPLAAALAFAPLWLLGEALRGAIGQFPWNLVGYAFAGWPALAQGAALGSVWWLGWLAVMLGTVPLALRAEAATRRAWLASTAAVLVALTSWGHVRLAAPTEFTDTRLRLVQGAFALDHGFEPERLRRWFFRQLELSAANGAAPVDAVLWSEGASPYHLAHDPRARAEIARMLREVGGPRWLLTGADDYVRDPAGRVTGVTNTLFAIGRDATIGGRYDKVDLVPFGEFLPFRPLLAVIGLEKLTAGTVDYVRGSGRTTMTLDGLPPFTPLICYEAIFAGRATGEERPEWLLNVTIDTWFGPTIGPYQHLAMARLRTVEEGLPLVRVANSGVSAVIDARGRMLESTELGPVAVLDVTLPEAAPPTLFARAGLAPALAWIAAFGIVGLKLERRARRQVS